MRNKRILCYLDDAWHDQLYIGDLNVQNERGREVYSFEWSKEYLERAGDKLFLDPQIYADTYGRQYAGTHFFGMFSDSCPNRWGRVLMKRREALLAKKEGRKPAALLESDYLLGVHDEGRMGALRFKTSPEGAFLADDDALAAPPWTELRKLQDASWNFEQERGVEAAWLSMLLAPGSSLGGARPKATVQDEQGALWIAKFPSKHDETNAGAWEMVAHDLAASYGLRVPEARAMQLTRDGTTFLVKRFDRRKGKRIHMASAMTMLEKDDRDHDVSYLDIADWLSAHSAEAKNDLQELWKRMVFNILISNTDDHLRNHGFLLEQDGWHLSPFFDVNPNPYGTNLSLGITYESNLLDISLAVETAEFYQISEKAAKSTVKEMAEIVASHWQEIARLHQVSRQGVENMEPAFQEAVRYSV